MHPVSACSIASNDHLAFARVFAESYRRHHPRAEVFVCIVDQPHPAVVYDQLPFKVVFAHDLGIPGFGNFAFRYDVLELSTAVKPYLLSYLRDHRDLDRVFYFDPDILICDRLTELAEALDRNDAVLTPHITQPLDDGHHPSDLRILQCGVYNLGFLGMRLDRGTAGFLEWWKSQLHRLCVVDLASGLFVDQSWMDMAPAFLDAVFITRDPIYNIAYWNLPHRQIEAESRPWRVNGSRVGFFHFSGIDLEDLESVSRHQDRLTLDRRPDVRPCFEHYRQLVLEAGHAQLRQVPYAYGEFEGRDIAIPKAARRTLHRVDPEGQRWPNPFASRGASSYYQWLVEPLEFEHGYLTRLALSLWEDRPDLSASLPRVCEDDLPHYVDWLRDECKAGHLAPLFIDGIDVKGGSASLLTQVLRHHDAGPLEDLDLILSLHDLVDLGRPADLVSWLNQPVPEGRREPPVITRLVMALYEMFADVQAAWPDPLDRDRLAVAGWFVAVAREHYQLPESLVAPVANSLTPEIRRAASERWSTAAVDHLRYLAALDQPVGLTSWLNRPAPAAEGQGPDITRLAMMLYAVRPDVQKVFADPLGEDWPDFAAWLLTYSRVRDRLPPVLVAAVERSVTPEVLAATEAWRGVQGVKLLCDLVARDQPAGLSSWLNQPISSAAPVITRLAMMVYEIRPDLQAAFPEPLGENQEAYARWFLEFAGREYPIPPALTEPVARSLVVDNEPSSVAEEEPSRPTSVAPWRHRPSAATVEPATVHGVNLAGHFQARTGIGQMGRSSAAVLEQAGIAFTRISLDPDPSLAGGRDTAPYPEGLPHPVLLLNENADMTPTALARMPLAAMVKIYRIGYWYWELPDFPGHLADRFSMLDEIWAASRFCQQSFEARSTIPVHYVPPFVPRPTDAPRDRACFDLDEQRFVFFYSFDVGSVPQRKNPMAAIEAIRRLRHQTDRPVGLLLRINRAELDPEVVGRLRRESEGEPVTIHTGTASRHVVNSMLATCDAILSLHRSEGLGLLPIEGLYLEKPVVATAYGGVTDYLDEATGFPVEHELIPLEKSYGPYPRGSMWAEPSLDHAVTQLVRVVEDPDEAGRRAAAGRRRVEELYGLEAAGKRFAEELARVSQVPLVPRAPARS